jgi:hypothetical protein
MIVTRKHARHLIAAEEAVETCLVTHEGRTYVAIDRYDRQRTDHYPAADSDIERLADEPMTVPL